MRAGGTERRRRSAAALDDGPELEDVTAALDEEVALLILFLQVDADGGELGFVEEPQGARGAGRGRRGDVGGRGGRRSGRRGFGDGHRLGEVADGDGHGASGRQVREREAEGCAGERASGGREEGAESARSTHRAARSAPGFGPASRRMEAPAKGSGEGIWNKPTLAHVVGAGAGRGGDGVAREGAPSGPSHDADHRSPSPIEAP